MDFEKARNSVNYLHSFVTKDTVELLKSSKMHEATLKKLGKITPTGYDQDKAWKWQIPGSQSQCSKSFCQKALGSLLKSTWQPN